MVKVQLPDGRVYYMDGMRMKILSFFRDATLYHNTSAVILYDGVSGSGKSTSAIQDGFFCDLSPSGFGLHKIYFTPEDFLDGLENAEPHSFHLYDEAMVLSNRATMSKMNQTIVRAMSMIRSKKIMVGFCINSIFDLDRNLALSRANILFHSYGKNLIDRGRFCAFFKGADGHDRLKQLYLYGKKYYTYNKPKANFIGRFGRRFLVDPEEYEIKKQKGVTEAISDTRKNTNTHSFHELVFQLKEKMKLESWQIAEMAGLTTRSIERYYATAVQRKMLTNL